MENTLYTLEEAAVLLETSPYTLKARYNRGQLSCVQIPFGNKRYKLGITQQVLDQLKCDAGEDASLYKKLLTQYLHEMKHGIITKRPVSEKYLRDTDYFLSVFWKRCGKMSSVKSMTVDNLQSALTSYEIDEAQRRDYYATKDNIFKAVTGFMRLLVREGYKSKADLESMKGLKPGKRFALKKPIYDLEKIQRAIEANELWTKGRRDYDRQLLSTLIALYGYAGLRKMEPTMLTMDKLHLEKGYLLAYGKGGVEDTVLILPALEPILRKWLRYRHQNSNFLMTSYDGTPLTSTSIQTRFQRFHEATNIEIRPHDLRRTFATLAAAQGMPTPLIQKQLRHRQLRTTEGYMMIGDQHLLEWGRKQFTASQPSVEPKILPSFQRR